MSERLPDPDVKDAARLPDYRVMADDEGGRIEQKAVIHTDRADGRVNSQTKPYCVRHPAEADVSRSPSHKRTKIEIAIVES